MLWEDEWLLPAEEKSGLRYKKSWGKSWPGPTVLQRRVGSSRVVPVPMQGLVRGTRVGCSMGGLEQLISCRSN